MIDERATARAVRRYRRLLTAFPRAYVREAAEEQCQVFEDQYREALQHGGVRLAELWLRVVLDTSTSLVVVWGSVLREEGRGAMTGVMEDVRAAVRSLRLRPVYMLSASLTLGLGIGAATTILSVVDGVMLRPLPYEDADRLVVVGGTDGSIRGNDGAPRLGRLPMFAYRSLQDRAATLDDLAALEPTSVFLRDEGDGPDEVRAARVASGLFETLGVAPALGRIFLPEEHRADGAAAVILSHGAWQRRFGGDPGAIGRPAPRFYQPAIIVGVLPEDFRPPEAFFAEGESPEYWLPLQPDHDRYRQQRPAVHAIGRLRAGSTLVGARTEASALATDLAAEHPDVTVLPDGSTMGIGVNALHAETVGANARGLGVFLGAAALLLALAAMNAGTLFLTRLLDRLEEIGVRSALGAGRARILRLLAAEACLVAILACALGVLLAHGGVAIFLRYAPRSIPSLASVAVDARVLALAAVVSLATGLLAGIAPALRWVRGQPSRHLQAGARSLESFAGLRPILAGGQVAVAVILLSCASLLFASFTRIRTTDPGFRAEGLVTFSVGLEGAMRSSPPGTITSLAQAWDLALEEIAAVPGVLSVAGVTALPFQPVAWAPRVLAEGDAPDASREGVAGYGVTPDYFSTLGAGLVAGRPFTRADRADTEAVVVVNEEFVRTRLGGGDALGRSVSRVDGSTTTPMRIVGIVGDVVQARVEDGARPATYVPHTQHRGPLHAIVRTPMEGGMIAADLRRAVARFNPVEPLADMTTMTDRMGAVRASPRFQSSLVASFAFVAVLLAAAGLYGSLAHWVGRRAPELGLRMALGASGTRMRFLVVRQGLVIAGGGLVVGLVGAVAFGRLLTGLLFDVSPHDPVVLLAATFALLSVSVVASLAPARRATAVDPNTVLRSL